MGLDWSEPFVTVYNPKLVNLEPNSNPGPPNSAHTIDHTFLLELLTQPEGGLGAGVKVEAYPPRVHRQCRVALDVMVRLGLRANQPVLIRPTNEASGQLSCDLHEPYSGVDAPKLARASAD
ncbi:hypothetical protein L0F63_004783 [Massospora cicadina]|nr:hypothetical protein L0F63_004783 [Massospora cicadina]